MDIFLSIVIPTFNRFNDLSRVLDVLVKQVDVANSRIEIIVADNFSEDETSFLLETISKDYAFIRFFRNNVNVGMIRNIIKGVNYSRGEYVWIIGDDDYYDDCIVEQVLNKLECYSPSFLFINHRGYSTYDDSGLVMNSALPTSIEEFYCDGRVPIMEIFQFSLTAMMFLGASVHRRKNLIEGLDRLAEFDLALPLYFVFFSASKGSMAIINKQLIDNVFGNYSWKEETNNVFCKFVPRNLFRLFGLEYSKKMVVKSMLCYIKSHWVCLIFFYGRKVIGERGYFWIKRIVNSFK